MEDLSLLSDMALVLGVALGAGLLAQRLNLPVVIGYLISGVVFGPHVMALIKDIDDVETLASIGAVLLMFTIGMEFSLKTLRVIGGFAVFGGLAQIMATIGLGLCVAWLLGEPFQDALLFGFFVSLSSTAIVLKILMDRGELGSVHGRVMIGILLIQDLSVVPMMAIIPSLGDTGFSLLTDIGWGLLKASVFLGATFALGWWGFPLFMRKIVGGRSRELFLLSIVCICFGAGFAADQAGLSVALGAFLAGLIISESEYAHQAIADIRPLRDTFAVLFFASLGMLANPEFIRDNPWEVGIIVLAIVAGKGLISMAVTRSFGYTNKTSLFVGSGLFQIGEFSFVLAAMALDEGHISNDLYDLTMTAAFITILLTPFGLGSMSRIYYRVTRSKHEAKLVIDETTETPEESTVEMVNHAVICGYGRVTRDLMETLANRGFKYLVIDIDPRAIRLARKEGIPAIFGDASKPEILMAAGVKKAKVLIIATPDPIATQLTVKNARAINKRLSIVARVDWEEDVETLIELGVSEIVRPEIEAGLEMLRHSLHRFGLTGEETRFIVNRLREKQVLSKLESPLIEEPPPPPEEEEEKEQPSE